MQPWQRTLYVLWATEFLLMAGMNLVIPFLPLYIHGLGVQSTADVERWTGLVFSASYMVSTFVQPLWGRLADRYGRRVMLLRSSIGMGVLMASMGLVTSVWQLFLLRALMGSVAGFISAATALQATQTPSESAGRALGTLQTGAVTGGLIGPFVGGVLAEWMSLRHVFFVTGGLMLMATVLVVLFIREDYKPDPRAAGVDTRSFFGVIRRSGVVIPLFVVSLVLQTGYLAIEPIVTLYVRQLSPLAPHLTTLAGATFAAVGVGNLISAPRLGRLADRIGPEKVLLWSLVAAAVLYLPQAFAPSAYWLMGMRVLLGLAVGGLLPAVQAMIRRNTPPALQGRAFGYNSSFFMAGSLIGPLLGGFISASFSIPTIFFVTAALFGLNALWVQRAVILAGGRVQADA